MQTIEKHVEFIIMIIFSSSLRSLSAKIMCSRLSLCSICLFAPSLCQRLTSLSSPFWVKSPKHAKPLSTILYRSHLNRQRRIGQRLIWCLSFVFMSTLVWMRLLIYSFLFPFSRLYPLSFWIFIFLWSYKFIFTTWIKFYN